MTRLRAIVTDLDGTFLSDGHTVSRGNLAAVRRAQEAGVRFVVATGRPVRWIRPLRDVLALDPVVIASNGACVLRGEGVVRERTIDPGTLAQVAQGVRRAAPGCAFALEYGETWAHEPTYGRRPEHERADVVAPLDDLDTAGVVKLLVWHPALPTDRLARVVSDAVGGAVAVTYSFLSDAGLVEVSAVGVTKASALSELLADWLIVPADVAGFGDMPNDVEMLRLVGRPFVPANGHQRLKDEGFEVIGRHDEDGVGRAIERLLDETG